MAKKRHYPRMRAIECKKYTVWYCVSEEDIHPRILHRESVYVVYEVNGSEIEQVSDIAIDS